MGVALCDLERPETFVPALDAAAAGLGGLDTVVVTGGMFATQEKLEADPELARRLLTVDFANTVVFCEEARRRLLRARRRNAVCLQLGRRRARAQAGHPLRRRQGGAHPLSRGSGPQVPRAGAAHRVREAGFRAHRHDRGPAPAAVRRRAGRRGRPGRCRAIDRGQPVVYAPGIWALIMLVIRWLPRFVMRKIGF